MTQMDDDRWRSCGSDWDDSGSGPGSLPGDEPASDVRSAYTVPVIPTGGRGAVGPVSVPADLGDCA